MNVVIIRRTDKIWTLDKQRADGQVEKEFFDTNPETDRNFACVTGKTWAKRYKPCRYLEYDEADNVFEEMIYLR